jgi:hypothetical protein
MKLSAWEPHNRRGGEEIPCLFWNPKVICRIYNKRRMVTCTQEAED